MTIACGPNPADAPDPPPPPDRAAAPVASEAIASDEPWMPEVADEGLRRGYEIWEILCAACHGTGGRGDGAVAHLLTLPPGDLTEPGIAESRTDEEWIQVTAEGLDGTPMIGWDTVLTEEELLGVTRYLRSLVTREREESRGR